MKMKTEEAFYTFSVMEPGREATEKLRGEAIDWEGVASTAFTFRSPLIFYNNMRRYGLTDRLREATLAKLKMNYLNIVGRNIRLKKIFLDLASRLCREGIKIIPLKGISLLMDTYIDEGLRSTEDVDIMIHGDYVERAIAIFKNAKYDVEAAMNDIKRPNRNHAYILFNPAMATIDLHHRLCPWYEEKYVHKIDSTVFFNDAVKKMVEGLTLHFLKKEDEFYFMLISIMRNPHLNTFKYYVDADSIVRVHHKDLDWEGLIKHIRTSGAEKYIMRVLNYLVEKLRTPFPADIRKELFDRRKARADFTTTLIKEDHNGLPMTKQEELIYMLRMVDSFFDKLRLALTYLKWQLFKRFGLFGNFFQRANNPSRSDS